MHRIVVLALDDVIAFDLSTPVEILRRVVDDDGMPLYRVRVAGPAESARSGRQHSAPTDGRQWQFVSSRSCSYGLTCHWTADEVRTQCHLQRRFGLVSSCGRPPRGAGGGARPTPTVRVK